MRAISICTLAALVAAALAPAGAALSAPGRLETRPARVALFKNGVGFIVREGNLSAAEGFTMVTQAAPAHGTFWVSLPREVLLTSLVASEVEVPTSVPATTPADLLQANIGKEVVIVTGLQGEDPIHGTLLAVNERPPVPPTDPYAWRSDGDSSPRGRLVLVKTERGTYGVDLALVRQVTVLGDEATLQTTVKVKRWQVEGHLAKPAERVPVTVSYVARGITWAPSYVVDISNAEQARLTAKATIINEAEDLAGTHVDLVTGFPNLRFQDIFDPLTGRARLAEFLSALGRGYSTLAGGDVRANVMAQSAHYEMEGAPMQPVPEYRAGAVGQSVEDLFFYPLENVSLAKGQTGYYPLFTVSVPFEQVYQWEIPDVVNEQDEYGRRQQEATPQEEVVWHCLRLTNNTKLPWTTAPVEVLKDGQLLGQDMLNFTPATANGTVRITRGLGIRAEQAEYETARERGVEQFYGYKYDRISLQGRARIRNLKPEPVTVEVRKTLSGEVQVTTPEAKVERLARGIKRMNPLNVLTWRITVPPGEERELSYSYTALIRQY